MDHKKIGLVIGLFVILTMMYGSLPLITLHNDENALANNDQENINSAGSWIEDRPSSIDDNPANNPPESTSPTWAECAASKPWCRFEGGYYIIENLTTLSSWTMGIRESTAPFRVINCFLGGLYLTDVENGEIIGTDIDGRVQLDTCSNMDLIDNTIYNAHVAGILLIDDTTDHINIINNTIINNYDRGFDVLDTVSYIKIINNTFIGNGHTAIEIKGHYNEIINNTIKDHDDRGLNMYWLQNSKVTGNSFTDCGVYFQNAFSISDVRSCTFQDNRANGKPIYHYVDEVGLRPENFTNAGQICVFFCQNSSIGAENVSRATLGAYLFYCKNVTITGLNASNNAYYGIYLNHGSENTIRECTIDNNCFGASGAWAYSAIYSFYSTYNNITNNTVYENARNGIEIQQGSHNTVFLNKIFNNSDGIVIEYSSDNTIEKNTITNNDGRGIYLESHTNKNNVTGNTVLGNDQCIVDEGTNNNIWGNDCGLPSGSSNGGGGGGGGGGGSDGENTIPFGNYYLWVVFAACLMVFIRTYRKIPVK